MSENRTVSLAVQRTLTMGAVVAGGVTCSIPAHAQQAQAGATGTEPPPPLQEVVVTGTRLRRVDSETASPVLVIDSKVIEQTGAQTVGELVDRIPSIAGAAMNPALNNGGGFGETNIELRGLGAQRTLILIDGQRVNLVGASGAVDVNQIPLNLIERVDVLNQGAGAIYGSDAIAGVVNFITKKNADGLELTGDWGETTKHDTQHHDIGISFGGHGDKFNFVAGAWYNQQDELNMGQRAWSRYALYLYSGSLSRAGSSRTPTGRIYVPAALGPPPGGNGTFNCPSGSVTRIVGTNGTSLADYRCFISHGVGDDHFNFQPYNLDVTPQERGALFSKMNYEINDYATAYASAIYNHTHSGFQLAPLPFDAQADNIIISKNNIYNPFGSDFGGISGTNPNFLLRLLGIGDRKSDSVSASLISRVGVKGKIGDSEWTYDGSLSYNRLDQDATIHGYFFADKLQNAVGPSFIDPATGQPTCGTPAAPITPCAPVNIFDLTDLGPAATSGFSAFYNTNTTFVSKGANLDFNGPLFNMWGGQALGAVGVDYSGLTGAFTTSAITQLQAPDFLTCFISTETCSANSYGKYNVKEGYGELFLPLLSNVPGVQSLNLDLGVRYSSYSLTSIGSTTRSSFKVEYRPVRDLLVRGSYAQIFRAPAIGDLFGAPAINAPTLNDICKNYTGANTAQYPFLTSACVGVPTTGTFSEPQNQVTGKLESNPNLKPETGYQYDGGIVFDPSFAPGLSFSADYWNYTVNNLITTLDPNYTIQQCGLTGDPTFCNLLHRFPVTSPSAGQFLVFEQPTFNLGTSKTDGVDIVLKYTISRTPAGNFNFDVNETHLMSWTNQASPGAAPQQIAGQYSKQFGFYTKNRATVNVGWSGWGAQALLTARYIGAVDIPLTNFNGTNFLGWHLPSVSYFDLSAGYTIAKTNTDLRVGILNLADKTPPIAGINTFNDSAVTDVFTYDTIGRRFFLGFTQRF